MQCASNYEGWYDVHDVVCKLVDRNSRLIGEKGLNLICITSIGDAAIFPVCLFFCKKSLGLLVCVSDFVSC